MTLMTDWRSVLTAVLLCVVSAIAPVTSTLYAADLVNGDLGYWLRGTAGPAISTLINDHPRFKGETIHIGAISNDRPGILGASSIACTDGFTSASRTMRFSAFEMTF